MSSQAPFYHVYLLTVWQEARDGESGKITWRFRLEDARSGRQELFADAVSLLAALRAMASTPGEAEGEAESGEN